MKSGIDSTGTETLTWNRTHLGATVGVTVAIPKGAYVAGALAAFFALEYAVEQMLLAMLPQDNCRPEGAIAIEQPKLQKREE